jgi:uncharacterized protein (TIGR02246 family)
MRACYSICSVLLTVSMPLWAAAARDNDANSIRELEAQQARAWNAHDARAYALLFTPDADIVNVLGWWWKGRAELEQKLTAGFSFVFAQSVLQIDDVAVRFITSDIAIVHVRWSMTGAISPDGSGGNVPKNGIQTQTVYRAPAGWQIASFQNTHVLPERSFPQRPR